MDVEKKFCKCVYSLRRREYSKSSAYAICTKSVYGSRGLQRQRMIACQLERRTVAQLRDLARERGLRITRNGRYLNKKQLVRSIVYKIL